MDDIRTRSNNYVERMEQSANYLSSLKRRVSIAIVLGSGLGGFADQVENPLSLKFSDIPNLPNASAPDHAAKLIFGNIGDRDVVIAQGRVHCHEGYSSQQVAFLVRVLHRIGAQYLILTNAAGGINADFRAGDIMFIRNHLSFFVEDPSLGLHHESLGPRYYDTTSCYDQDFYKHLLSFASSQKISAHTGVYVMLKGPRYESDAEIKALRALGADAVGMSTIPEALAAKQIGYKQIIGISLISNQAAGILSSPINHEEVRIAAEAAKPKMSIILKECVSRMP